MHVRIVSQRSRNVPHSLQYHLYSPYAICGLEALLTFWKANKPVVTDSGTASQRVTVRCLKMAAILVGVFVWNTACNVTAVVIVCFFPGLSASSPVNSM